jgi:hypothetical protein
MSSSASFLRLSTAPVGMTLSSDGVISWLAASNGLSPHDEEDEEHALVVEADGDCGAEVVANITLKVRRCPCLNGGECVDHDDEEEDQAVCLCPRGFSGKILMLLMKCLC